MQEIPFEEISFHPLSIGDESARLFWWKGELFRALKGQEADFFLQLFRSGLIEDLVERELLVDSSVASFRLAGYSLILKHECIPFVSYVFEWTGEMLRHAALTSIRLEMELAARDLTLRDAHPWNLLFKGTEPLHVDLHSIQSASNTSIWGAYDEFCRFFLNPLLLMSHGHPRVARWLMHDWNVGVRQEDLIRLGIKSDTWHERVRKTFISKGKALIPTPLRPHVKKVLRFALPRPRIEPVIGAQQRIAFLDHLKRRIEELRLTDEATHSEDYYHEHFPSFFSPDEWGEKHRLVSKILDDVNPGSVLDIGSNRGWYSLFAAANGADVVSLDVNEIALTRLYSDAKAKRLPVLPLVMDFRNPSPGYGINNAVLQPATTRLRCDLVLGLALVHHLVYKQKLTLEQVVAGLHGFVDKYLLVEFIPSDDRYVVQWGQPAPPSYTEEHFRRTLGRYFKKVTQYPSDPEPRSLLLCEA